MEYKIVIRIENFESPIITVNAEDWEDVCNWVFGNIEIIDAQEEE